jgi:aspartate aminotransferase
MKEILIEPHVDLISIPENIKVGFMSSYECKQCVEQGKEISFLKFALGESPFNVPGALVNSLKDNASRGRYSDATGIYDLRCAVAGFNKRYFGINVDESRIIIGPGTKQLIDLVFEIVRGDVIIPTPCWMGYAPQIRLLGKQIRKFKLDPQNGYKINPQELDKFISEMSGEQHILVVNNPHNPTGALYTREELESMSDICRKHSIFVLSDEIYANLTYCPEKFVSMGVIYPEGTFVTNGISKDRSAGGYRLGSCILPEVNSQKLKDDFKKVAAAVYTNVATPIQYAAIASYLPNEELEDYIRTLRQIHALVGEFMSTEINKIESIKATVPQGTFYLFVDFNDLKEKLKEKGVNTSNDLEQSLMGHPFHMITITGDACMLDPDDFGARISFTDYDGETAYQNFKKHIPSPDEEKRAFIEQNMPNIIEGIRRLRAYSEFIRS